ncbi:Alpha-1,3-mannosyltransferase-like protein [Thoreauomyces humboldtii]|nr:Alpha-1,3-mannosyltransferase-like protein [Thoreauomyces humboldtii]
MLRSLVIAVHLLLPWSSKYDIIFVDQLSATIPLLRFTNTQILFYCHFPDKLLTKRETPAKRVYRLPVDFIEEITTKMADVILVNSNFTAGIFQASFPTISRTPKVLYPGIHLASYEKKISSTDPELNALVSDQNIILSINRFERKKNIELAIRAFHALLQRGALPLSGARLVVAGGYDPRVLENVLYLEDLKKLAECLSLKHHVFSPSTAVPPSASILFLPSFTESQRTHLLTTSLCLLYTPTNEHFGIVPVEAMYAGLPVVAVASGGPTETILDGITGYLCADTPAAFADAMDKILSLGTQGRTAMGRHGRQRVEEEFSLDAFVTHLEDIVAKMVRGKDQDGEARSTWLKAIFITGIGLSVTWAVLLGFVGSPS